MPSPNKQTCPKGFYEKGRELFSQAQKIEDAELRREAIRASLRYYAADVTQDRRLLVAIVVLFLLVAGTVILAFMRLQFLSAAAVVLCAFTFFSLLIGVILRSLGYISESSLLGIWKEGFKTLRELIRTKQKDG
jgi:hypothetical protein